MNRAILLGSLFLHAVSVYGAATHGDLIAEGRRRNEEAYEKHLEKSGWKQKEKSQVQKMQAPSAAVPSVPSIPQRG